VLQHQCCISYRLAVQAGSNLESLHSHHEKVTQVPGTHPTAVMLLAAISCKPPATASRMLPSSTSLLSDTSAGASGIGKAATLLGCKGPAELCTAEVLVHSIGQG
jgi:N-acetyl-gamma-glutamylphosphate reductase